MMYHIKNCMSAGIVSSIILFSGISTLHAEENNNVAPEQEIALAQQLYENENKKHAFNIFRKHAENGNTVAEAWLGRCYMNGIGTEVDLNAAYQYFSRAAKKNDPWGLNGLGVCYQFGLGVTVDLQKGISYIQKAADMDLPIAVLNMARHYSDKEGGGYNKDLAVKYFKKAIDLSAEMAHSDFAHYLIEEKQYGEAYRLLADSAIFDPRGWHDLAACCDNGWGTEINTDNAAEMADAAIDRTGVAQSSLDILYYAAWEEYVIHGETPRMAKRLKKAADGGHNFAKYYYAVMQKNKGNIAEAIKYMKEVADADYEFAYYELGEMFLEKEDFPQAIKYFTLATLYPETESDAVLKLSHIYHDKQYNIKEALYWDQRGTDLDIVYCQNEIARHELGKDTDAGLAYGSALLAKNIYQDPGNEFANEILNDVFENKYEQLRIMADNNNPHALFALAIYGGLLKKDHPSVPIGLELLQKAADLKDPLACYILADIFQRGELVKQDYKKSFEYSKKAAIAGHREAAGMAVRLLCYAEALKDIRLKEYDYIFSRCIELGNLSCIHDIGVFALEILKNKDVAMESFNIGMGQNDITSFIVMHDLLRGDDSIKSLDVLFNVPDSKKENAEIVYRMGQWGLLEKKYHRNAFHFFLIGHVRDPESRNTAALAECFLNGTGCEKNIDCFWKLADRAYKSGSADICETLGTVFLEGKVTPKDLKEAKKYFEEGVKRGSKSCAEALKNM